jgi:hypothetical protein
MITLVKSLDRVSPAFNPVEIQLSSNEQTRQDFRYIVRIKDSGGNVIATKRPVGGSNTNDVVTVDISGNIARLQYFNAWRYNVTGTDFIYYDNQFRQGFSIDVSEYYDAAEHNPITISDVFTIPAALSSLRFPSYTYAELKNAGKWLTNFDRIRVRTTDKLTTSFFCPINGVTTFTYRFFDADGNIIASKIMNNPATTGIYEDVLHIHSGLSEIKTYTGVSQFVIDNTSTLFNYAR